MSRSLVPAAAVAALTLFACGLPVTQGPAQNGTLCTTAEHCASGVCSDGVCCENACEGECVSCAVPGSEGVCTQVPDGEDPRGDCGQGTCGGVCNGGGACRYPGADTACGEKVCAGDSVQQAACNGAGECSFTTTPCAPFACEAGACLTSCADPLDCAVTGRCLPDGTCESKLPPGSDCASGAACASGYCADGVCCDKPCAGTCEACHLAGSEGTCTFIPVGEDPSVECPGDAPCGSSCDGQGACAYGAAGVQCGTPSCNTPDAPLVTKQCNGAGACLDATSSCGDYACLGNGCKTSCGSATDCRVTAFCSGGQCVPKRTLGEACANPDECLSGHCVDGVCCSSACGDACDSCAAGTPGLCAPLGAGETPQLSCGTGQACGQTTSCPGACSATSPCEAGFYCDPNGSCQQERAIGVACAQDGECGSGFCDDGVCCATDCSNTPCRSCNLSQQTAGQCLPVPWGTASPQCPGNNACRADGQCGSGACADDQDCKAGAFCAGASGCQTQKTNGLSCGRSRECQSGFCIDGVCCNSDCAGACRGCNLPGAAGACTNVVPGTDPFAECPGGYACGSGGTCNAACSSNGSCEPGFICQAGACVAGKPLGQTCAAGSECVSGNCVDGVCCNTACGSACSACDVPNALGVCTPLPANTDDSPPDCSNGRTCDGAGACRNTCSTNAQCKQGYGCKAGACVLLAQNGASCAVGADCQSGSCADGVCCNSACTQKCEACNVPGKLGACVPFAPTTDPQNECGLNTCNGQSACGTTCVLDQNCAVGSYCNGGACAVKKPLAAACTANNQCAGGLCVEGVCCNSACTGDCRSCVIPGAEGTCTSVPAGEDLFMECTGGLACNGAMACNTTCAGAGDCESGFWCDTSTSTCVPDLPQGTACTLASQCAGNRCVDGVCCNSACGAACDACNVSGSEGTCVVVPQGSSGAPSCSPYVCNGAQPACPNTCVNGTQTGCAPGNFCTTGNACAPKKNDGTVCAAGYECSSGSCVDGVCCNTACTGACDACNLPGQAGTCGAQPAGSPGAPSCTPYVCNGAQASCPNTCVNATQQGCATGFFCDTGNACQPKKANASACTGNFECSSGNCVDGVCCNTACAGGCNRCDAPGSVGTCSLLPQGSSGYPSGVCDPYSCNGSNANCLTSCTTNSQCTGGYFCNGSTCEPKKGLGGTCANNSQCQNSQCVDGRCCDSACTGSCRACNLAGMEGFCSSIPAGTDPGAECGNAYCNGAGACATSCTAGTQCKNGNCADGVCCNNACTSTCRACNLTGSEGTCTNIPNGQDPDNECSGTMNVCNGSGACTN